MVVLSLSATYSSNQVWQPYEELFFQAFQQQHNDNVSLYIEKKPVSHSLNHMPKRHVNYLDYVLPARKKASWHFQEQLMQNILFEELP